MALHTLGTNANTSLVSLPAWSPTMAAADVAALAAAILNDGVIGAIASGYSAGKTAFIGTGSTHTNTTLDSIVADSGSPPVAQIHVGDVVLGAGITVGTYVQAISGTTVTLSQAATATAAGVHIIIARRPLETPKLDVATGILTIPMRGTLKVLPGDYVAVDKSGAVILVPGNAVGYAGSVWHFV